MGNAPVRLFDSLFNEFDKMFGKSYVGTSDLFDDLSKEYRDVSFPKYNLFETNEGYHIEVALAGFDRDDLEVYVEKRNLYIKSKDKNTSEKKYIHKGIAERKVNLSFKLSDNIGEVEGKFEDGMLKLFLPRLEEKQERKNVVLG